MLIYHSCCVFCLNQITTQPGLIHYCNWFPSSGVLLLDMHSFSIQWSLSFEFSVILLNCMLHILISLKVLDPHLNLLLDWVREAGGSRVLSSLIIKSHNLVYSMASCLESVTNPKQVIPKDKGTRVYNLCCGDHFCSFRKDVKQDVSSTLHPRC